MHAVPSCTERTPTWKASEKKILVNSLVKTNWVMRKQGTILGASQVALVVKNLPANAGRHKRWGFDPWVGKIPWRRAWQPTPVFLPGESHGQRRWWLQSMGSQRVRHDWVTQHTMYHTSYLWQAPKSPDFCSCFPPRIHISVQIPHQDGMLPLISTMPLHNLHFLLSESIYRHQHVCSNLVTTRDLRGISGEGRLPC